MNAREELRALATGIRPLGDDAVLVDVEGGHRGAAALARRLRARDVIPASGTLGLVGEYRVGEAVAPVAGGAVHEVEVSFDGEDVVECGLRRQELESCLASVELEVAFLGFMPGFAYLVGLPEALGSLPRRRVPRARVPAGSFAVAGGYAGIYPSASPGGWNLLGRTGLRVFDPLQPPYALFQPADRVVVHPVAATDLPAAGERRPLDGRAVEVLAPGPLLLVEDRGRDGVGSLGVPRAGGANPLWQAVANAAVGNGADAAVLETAGNTAVKLHEDVLVALAGEASMSVDGTALPPQTVAAVAAGQTIHVGSIRRYGRAVLAFGGGLVWEGMFASRSCDPVSGLGPGPLRRGDVLDLGTRPARARLRFEVPRPAAPVRLRAVAGPDPVDPRLLGGAFAVAPSSDRTGIRLRRLDPQPAEAPAAVHSHAVVPGAVQLPPQGEPVILGPDCGPVGGYPVVATVITADLWRLGTLGAGDEVEFRVVDVAEAREAGRCEMEIARLLTGWYPTAFA